MIDILQIKTAFDLKIARETGICVAADQLEELKIGCITWGFVYEGSQRGQMTIWPNGRGAISFGGESQWGEVIQFPLPYEGVVYFLRLEDNTVYNQDGKKLKSLNDYKG